jgi:hypothetical protein
MLPVLLMKQVQTWQIATIHRPCGPTGNGILFQTRGGGPLGDGPSEFKTGKKKEKSLLFLPQLSRKYVFPPSTPKLSKSHPSTFQTVHFNSL